AASCVELQSYDFTGPQKGVPCCSAQALRSEQQASGAANCYLRQRARDRWYGQQSQPAMLVSVYSVGNNRRAYVMHATSALGMTGRSTKPTPAAISENVTLRGRRL